MYRYLINIYTLWICNYKFAKTMHLFESTLPCTTRLLFTHFPGALLPMIPYPGHGYTPLR